MLDWFRNYYHNSKKVQSLTRDTAFQKGIKKWLDGKGGENGAYYFINPDDIGAHLSATVSAEAAKQKSKVYMEIADQQGHPEARQYISCNKS